MSWTAFSSGTLRAKQKMDVVRHDDKVMQAKLRQVSLRCLQEEVRPALVAEQTLAACCLEGHKVSLVGFAEEFSFGPHPFPPGLKPLDFNRQFTAGLKPRPFKAQLVGPYYPY